MSEQNHGRPLAFETVEELDVAIEEYFASCEEEVWQEFEEEDGSIRWKPVINHKGEIQKYFKKAPTMSGLAVFIGVDRRTLLNYSKREPYFPTVSRAKARIEAYSEEQLYNRAYKNHSGIMFSLRNNFDWVDKTEVRHEGGLPVQIVDDIGADDE